MANTAYTTIPSRRLFLAAGSASAVFGALAKAVLAASNPVAQAIERHRAATAAVYAFNDPHEDIPSDLLDAQSEALNELAETPCGSDAKFVQKMQYLPANHKNGWGAMWDNHCPEILTALDLHLASAV